MFEVTTLKSNASAEVVRQEAVSQDGVEIVQDLVDSGELVQANPIENEVADVVSSAADIQKPVSDEKPGATSAIESVTQPINTNDPNPINKFCSCSSSSCKCCRDFSIPLIPIRGPGCATIRYLENDRLSIAIKYGDFVLASRQVDSRRPTPICLPLPGGYNRFCGRVYGKLLLDCREKK